MDGKCSHLFEIEIQTGDLHPFRIDIIVADDADIFEWFETFLFQAGDQLGQITVAAEKHIGNISVPEQGIDRF